MRIKKRWVFALFVLALITVMIAISSCVSTKQKARNYVRKGWEKVEKGLALDPSLADSVMKMKTIEIEVPVEKDSIVIKTVVDSTQFNIDIQDYDKLVLQADSLGDLIENKELTGSKLERSLNAYRRLSKSLREQRDRFMLGYSVDSVYTFEDSVVIASIEIKNGLLQSFKYETKERSVSTDVKTTTVNLDGRKVVGKIWESSIFWGMLFVLIVMGVMIYFLIKSRK